MMSTGQDLEAGRLAGGGEGFSMPDEVDAAAVAYAHALVKVRRLREQLRTLVASAEHRAQVAGDDLRIHQLRELVEMAGREVGAAGRHLEVAIGEAA